MAHWTAGLLILSHSFYVKLLRNALIQQTRSSISIHLSDAKFDAPKKIGPQPVHPNCVLICEIAFDVRRAQNATEKEGVWHVSKPAQDYKPLILVFGVSDGHSEPTVYALGRFTNNL
jgi:hypothetical protein